MRNPLPKVAKGRGMLGLIGAGLSKYNTFDMDVAQRAATGCKSHSAKQSHGLPSLALSRRISR